MLLEIWWYYCLIEIIAVGTKVDNSIDAVVAVACAPVKQTSAACYSK